jgi:diacylglycerol kinase
MVTPLRSVRESWGSSRQYGASWQKVRHSSSSSRHAVRELSAMQAHCYLGVSAVVLVMRLACHEVQTHSTLMYNSVQCS